MKNLLAIMVVVLLLSTEVSYALENPAVIQSWTSQLNQLKARAASQIGDDDVEAFKHTIKVVFRLHDKPDSRLKNVTIDYSKHTNLLEAERALKQTLKQGLDKFNIPGEDHPEISSDMIKLIRDDSVHIIPENPETAGGAFGVSGSTLGWIVFGLFMVVLLIFLIGRGTIGNLIKYIRGGGRPPEKPTRPPEEEAQDELKELIDGLGDLQDKFKP